MVTSRTVYACSVLVALAIPFLCGASDSGTKNEVQRKKSTVNLTIVQDVVVQSEIAGLFVHPIKCDSKGNVYMRRDLDVTSGIIEVDPQGKKRLATFVVSSTIDPPVWHTGYFAIDSNGKVQQLADLRDSLDRLVIKFNKDGSYESSVKLDAPPGFQDWSPTQLAVFANGDLLVAGYKHDNETRRIRIPFTGLFNANGKFKKEIVLADDDDIRKMGEDQDRRVTDAVHPFGNRAIDLALMEAADDGNIYFMRRLSPAIVYAISPVGEVLRRFTIDAGNADYMPVGLHTAGAHLAVLFYEPQTSKELLAVTDLEGAELTTYREPEKDGQGLLGSAFACYTQKPERFTFLYTTDEHSLGLHIVEPR